MISETLSNVVYFSSLLPERCPKTFRGLKEVLERYGVEYRFLHHTKDIWCRDYMPIQIYGNHFALFGYNPDYLQDTQDHRESITDNFLVSRQCGGIFVTDQRGILLDGGNVVHSGSKVVMTSKVFEENPGFRVRELSDFLEKTFGAEVIILPWDTNEIYGHTDGILRFIDPDTVLLTNNAQFDRKMADRFKRICRLTTKIEHLLTYKN